MKKPSGQSGPGDEGEMNRRREEEEEEAGVRVWDPESTILALELSPVNPELQIEH